MDLGAPAGPPATTDPKEAPISVAEADPHGEKPREPTGDKRQTWAGGRGSGATAGGAGREGGTRAIAAACREDVEGPPGRRAGDRDEAMPRCERVGETAWKRHTVGARRDLTAARRRTFRDLRPLHCSHGNQGRTTPPLYPCRRSARSPGNTVPRRASRTPRAAGAGRRAAVPGRGTRDAAPSAPTARGTAAPAGTAAIRHSRAPPAPAGLRGVRRDPLPHPLRPLRRTGHASVPGMHGAPSCATAAHVASPTSMRPSPVPVAAPPTGECSALSATPCSWPPSAVRSLPGTAP